MRQNTDQPSSKFNLLRLWLLICTTLASTLSFGQAGNAPMQTLPSFPGNFAIDGFLQRQGVNGDWLPAAGGSANNFVMNNAGVPVVPLGYHVIDLYNDQISDDIFDGGNKLNQNPNVWGWRSQKPPGKDDINNATVFLAVNPANSHIWVAMSGDRMETNGTSYLDFEFYQNTITKNGGPLTGGFTSTGPHNGRTVGDLSLTLQYTQGGSFASIFYLQWQPGAEAGTYDYFEITPAGGSAFAAANGGVADINVPYGAFGGTVYHTLQFVEGAVDMTALIGGVGLPGECGSLPFKSIFIKTKSSAASTADLKDFIEPLQIQACFDRTAPIITCPNTLNLGCNPTIPGPSGATASDNCDGTIIPVSSDGPVQSSGCSRTMNRTWRAQDACGNAASCIQVINWTEDNTAPSITTGGTTTNLGCNPSGADINNALGTASATDACGAPTLSSSDGSVSSNGCGRSQTRTWTARDGCGNTSTAARTVNWTSDNTPPTITANGTGTSLGCNPSANDIDLALGSASATDACGPTTVTQSDGPINSDGCSRSRTRTFTARDGCGNTATTSRTANWIADTTPPTIQTGGTTTNLGCNPAASDINNALGTASATDACGSTTTTPSDGPVNSTGCSRSQTRTWTARDGCGNTATASRTVNWTADQTPPTFTGSFATIPLGCNPAASDISGALGSASATDACGPTTVSQSDGPVNSDGCSRSQTRTFTAKDGCNNTATASRTVTWTADNTPPAFVGNFAPVNLGCNPVATDVSGSLGTASATDACGAVTITQSDGAVSTTACGNSQTRTFTARDGCGNTATVSRTVNWGADQTPPQFTGSYATVPLGCNPAASDITGALDGATATDACGPTTVTQSDGAVQSSGCTRSQTRTFTAKDGCNNTATTSRTVTWTSDVTPPQFTGSYTAVQLGCNPAASDISAALDGSTATDACGPTTTTQSDGSVSSDGCSRSQTRTFTARDGCGNTATISRTVTWTADQTPPTFTGSYASIPLGCNPAASDISGALGSASATDACGPTTVTQSDGSVLSDGCSRSQTRTFTAKDGCNNTATTSRTVTWTADVTPPTFTGSYTTVQLGCNPAASDITAALDGSTATDACGPTTTTQSDGAVSSTGCSRSQTRTFTARDGCGNTATISRTVTWTADQTPPTFTGSYTSIPLGCNPAASDITGALGSASATDACGPTTVTQSDGGVSSDGCSRSQTRTFTAKDGCGNTATTSRTVTWTSDVTPPTFTGSYGDVQLGCNPAASDITAALDGSTATDACGPTTTTQSDGSVQSSGCSRSQTRTFTARDGCGNTATASRTVRWTADQTPPTFTGSYTTVQLGCNPAASDVTGALGSASATDACGPTTVTQSDGAVQSSGCGRSQVRTFTARDGCGNTATTSRTVTWTSDNTAPVFTNVPASADYDCGTPVPTAATPSATDACGTPTVTQTGNSDNTTDCSTGFSRVVVRTWKATDACGNTSTASQTIRIRCCPSVFCTYTQGQYGTEGGGGCDGVGNNLSTAGLISLGLSRWPLGTLVVGKPGHSISMSNNATDIACIIDVLPGNQGSTEIAAGNFGICGLPNSMLTNQHRIKNVLAGQTITLGINMGINVQLGNFTLQAGVMATQDLAGGCGTTTPKSRVCNYNPLAPYNLVSVTNEYTYKTFSPALIAAIPGTKNVTNLFELANRALGNTDGVAGTENGVSLDEIQQAVANINEGFDECMAFIGWNVAACPSTDPAHAGGRIAPTAEPTLAVTAFPNPYQENFSLKVNSPVTGQASIGFYTIDGVKIGEMKRDVVANKDVWVPFNVPSVYRTRIVYTVAVGGYNAKGVVLSPNEPNPIPAPK